MGQRFYKQTIHGVDLRNRTVLVRVDYNVPLKKNGVISDDLRIRASLPTIRYLLEQGCKIVLISHLGRPKGRDAKYSLRPVAGRLAELLGHPVRFVDDCVGDKVRQAIKSFPGGVILLENLRFYSEEEAGDDTFARALARASGADYFVQDGFAVTHRAHASTKEIVLCLPGVAGDLVVHEYETITKAMENPKRPLVAVVGGAKVSDKISLIYRLIERADRILIGGAMANTFLAYLGNDMRQSRVEPDQESAIKAIIKAAETKVGADKIWQFLLLPQDVAVGEIDGSIRRETKVSELSPGDNALDVGTQTIGKFAEVISHAGTVIWNGTLGYAENPIYAIGSARVALAIAQNQGVTSIIGGGDTADFVLDWDGQGGANFTHVSTGGGASLALMAGEALPGIDSLLDAHGWG